MGLPINGNKDGPLHFRNVLRFKIPRRLQIEKHLSGESEFLHHNWTALDGGRPHDKLVYDVPIGQPVELRHVAVPLWPVSRISPVLDAQSTGGWRCLTLSDQATLLGLEGQSLGAGRQSQLYSLLVAHYIHVVELGLLLPL
jgi:hypothetical protein